MHFYIGIPDSNSVCMDSTDLFGFYRDRLRLGFKTFSVSIHALLSKYSDQKSFEIVEYRSVSDRTAIPFRTDRFPVLILNTKFLIPNIEKANTGPNLSSISKLLEHSTEHSSLQSIVA